MKRAIVLAGGGAKGSYQMGLWKALRELGINYDIVTGSSVGALNATLMAQGDFDSAYEMWTTIKTEDIFEKTPSHLSTIMNTDGLANGLKPIFGDLAKNAVNEKIDAFPLDKLIDKYIDEEKIKNNGKILGIMATEYPIFKCAPFFYHDIPKGRLGDYLLASSAVFPSIEPKSIKGKKYIDGGYSDNCPVNMALDIGATEIIACFLNASGVNGKYQTDIPVRMIKPHFYLGPSMEFDPETALHNITLGYNDTMRSFGEFDGHWFTFKKDEYEVFLKKYSLIFAEYVSKFKICKQSEMSHYYDCLEVKKFVESKNARIGTMQRLFPMLVAETAGDLLEVNPVPVYSEEEFSDAVSKAYDPVISQQNKIEEILNGKSNISRKAKLMSEIDSKTIVSYIAENIKSVDTDKSVKTNLTLLSRLATAEFFSAIYISKIKGYIR